jgi:glucose-6-phosphate dehydrogenase assembly protein OpcA
MNVVQPERILKELGKLWVDLGKQEESGVLRACAMTLIVVLEESQDTQEIGETIASLMHEHPSRAIVLRVRAGGEPFLEARVFAQCWMPFGRRQQICCEQIEITASVESLPDVPAVLRGIIVPDLPVVIYCPSENLWRAPSFQEILPLAGKLILDSMKVGEPAHVVSYLNDVSAVTRETPLLRADLAWSRLTPWRESIAHIFEDGRRAHYAFEMEEVRILHTGAGESAAVYYLAGWFMHVLGAGVRLQIARGVGPGYASIAHVQMKAPQFDAILELISDVSVELRIDGERQQMIVLPPMNDYNALRQELTVLSRDPVFEDVLGLTQLLRGQS